MNSDRMEAENASIYLPFDNRQAVTEEAQSLKHGLEDLLTPLMSLTERPGFRQPTKPEPYSVSIKPNDIDVYRHFTNHVSPKLEGSAIDISLQNFSRRARKSTRRTSLRAISASAGPSFAP